MRRLTEKDIEALAAFEHLPDAAAAPLTLCALVSGICVRTWRDNPPIPTFHVSAHRKAANVGKLRRLTRGELAAPTP
jgi:hypothetical protein